VRDLDLIRVFIPKASGGSSKNVVKEQAGRWAGLFSNVNISSLEGVDGKEYGASLCDAAKKSAGD
jgi:hypothetical protein